MRSNLFTSSALICALALPTTAWAAVPTTAEPRTLHAVETREDVNRAPVFLARRETSAIAQGGGESVTLWNYKELCRLPCSAEVDLSERPLFVFVGDGRPVSKPFRVPDFGDDIALRFRAARNGLYTSGALLLPLVIGIPMYLVGRPLVLAAPGTTEQATDFVRLKGGR